jgi:hypothetical protein
MAMKAAQVKAAHQGYIHDGRPQPSTSVYCPDFKVACHPMEYGLSIPIGA